MPRSWLGGCLVLDKWMQMDCGRGERGGKQSWPALVLSTVRSTMKSGR